MGKELEITDEQRVATRLAIVQELVRGSSDMPVSHLPDGHVAWAKGVAEAATILSNMVLGVEDPPQDGSEARDEPPLT